MGNKVVGIIVTVAFFVLVALVGYRLYQEQSTSQEASAPPAVEDSDQAKAPEPEDKAGEESAADTDASPEKSASAEDEAGVTSSDADATGADRGDSQASGEEALGDNGEVAEGDSADIPSFDVVRVEQTGEGVIAGRAEPSWDVALQSNGDTIAETKADPAGQWSLVLDEPLGAGEHSLSILATSPDGEKSLTSQQKVLVSMGDEAGGKTVVALREPGKATQILQEQAAGESGAGEGGEASGPDESKSQERLAAADTEDGADQAGSETDGGQADGSAADDDDASASSDEASSEAAKTASGADEAGDEGSASGKTASSEGDEDASASDTVEAKQAGEEQQGLPEPPVRIKTVDYEDRGDQSGQIIVTGISTKPTTDILLYLDGELIGEGQTDATGDWKIEATHYLAPGNRSLQVDLVNREDDVILGRAAVGMRRQTPPPTAEQVAQAEPEGSGQSDQANDGDAGSSSASDAETGAGSDAAGSGSGRMAESERVAGDRATSGASDMSLPESAAAPESASAPEEQETADADMPDPDRAPGEEIPDPDRSPGDMASADAQSQPDAAEESSGPKLYTVRRGDTLWAIAEEHFGGGWRYTMIFKDNRGKIRNPHWIYPDQQFQIRPEQ